MYTICFTGHRPSKLGGYDLNSPVNKRIQALITTAISDVLTAHPDGDVWCICGGALGIDQMAADSCIKLRNSNQRLHLKIAVPFADQPCKWFSENVQRWQEQLVSADEITYVDGLEDYSTGETVGRYSALKMQMRNQYMVDGSDAVIAYWNGSAGGTANCVNYAKRLNKQIIYLPICR